ncbi:MAG: bifunctional [glutamate--ammonia ligase]-adenylyl-L-tyrosine phosphorylase/[glutamate--ammonia-ligase] adenylyltransferase [Planctomycetaceae bacterium]
MRREEQLKRLHGIGGLRGHLPVVRAYLERAADPESVAVGLARIFESGGTPLPHLEGWMALLDASPASVEPLLANPGLLQEIPRSSGSRDRETLERELDEALRDAPTHDARLDHLRSVRVEETLRIAWQDVVEGADLTVTTQRISELAEILLERVLRLEQQRLTEAHGRPWAGSEPVGMAVIAMGKLGGSELNYSSDIDLVYLYGKDGATDGGASGRPLSNREFFHRLAERTTRDVDAATPRGRLYRVDLRLRPEGATGALARSLASSVAYYRQMGETWERQAFLKARAIAGDRGIAQEFVDTVRAWSYGRGLSFQEIASLKRIKGRIEQATITRGEEHSEVKLGYGGIRDVEYVIQFLQLLHGARDPALRHHNSLTSLRLLEARGAILPEERDVLDDAYRFLRRVEHRLQLVQGAQVHTMPQDEAGQLALARRCGFDDATAFRAAYVERAGRVRTVFNRLFRQLFSERDAEQMSETDLLLREPMDEAALSVVLQAHGIAVIPESLACVGRLCVESSPLLRGSPRTRKFLADLFPRLLDALQETPDPGAALHRLERITAHVGARGTLYEAMASDDRLLRLLLDIAGHSRFLTNILERAPGVLDQVMDALATVPDRGLSSFEDIPTATVPTAPDPVGILAHYKELETLRIGLRDISGERPLRETSEDLSRLAEVIVRLAYDRARQEIRQAGSDLVVVALGKLGARELLYGSDLDLVYFWRGAGESRGAESVARRLSALLETPSAHGKLYAVDLRLRPGGSGGRLITTAEGFTDYFARGLGQVWERLAYTRARPIAGPPALCEEVAAALTAAVYGPGFYPQDAEAVAAMRAKLAAAAGPDSLKRAVSGGVVDIEFLAQMHALARGGADPRYRDGNVPAILRLLEEESRLDPQRAADARAAYRFLVSLESRIRIVADLPEDRLPEEPAALRALARRLGYVDTGSCSAEQSLREEHAYHRDVAARAFRDALALFGAKGVPPA